MTVAGWRCLDGGHEFMCRYSEGSCNRTGLSSCNAPEDAPTNTDPVGRPGQQQGDQLWPEVAE